MSEKRKIIIPVGNASQEAASDRSFDGDTTVQAPFFDSEATIAARPVVPITEAEQPQSKNLPLLVLVVLLAIGAGVAGGFAIGVYNTRQNTQEATATSTAATTTINSDETARTTEAQQLPAVTSEKTSEPAARRAIEENTPTERNARDKKTKDDEQLLPPVEIKERGKERRARDDRDEEERSEREQAREIKRQKKEQRRRARENDQPEDINQQIEHGARELNRIREIFEGQRP